MISTAKIVKMEYDEKTNKIMVDQEDSPFYSTQARRWRMGDEEYVEVIFDDGTFVALSEEELRNAAVLAERGSLGGEFWSSDPLH